MKKKIFELINSDSVAVATVGSVLSLMQELIMQQFWIKSEATLDAVSHTKLMNYIGKPTTSKNNPNKIAAPPKMNNQRRWKLLITVPFSVVN